MSTLSTAPSPDVDGDRSPPPGAPPPTFWASVRAALAGSDQDFTEGALGRAILLLAIPMVLEMVMESLFAVVDLFFVAKVSEAAVAALGLTESVMTVLYAVAIGVSVSATATVARRTGEKDPLGASQAAAQALYLTIALALPLGVLGALAAPSILQLMGAAPDVVAVGAPYARIMMGANVTVLALFILNGVFRGAGAAQVAMRALWLGNALNIVLGPCFIFGLGPFPKLGMAGAAVGTSLGRGLAVVYQLWVLARGNPRVSLTRESMKVVPSQIWSLLRLSLGGMGQYMVATASWIGLVRIVALFGKDAVAGYTIAVRIIMFALLPAWGMANAAATLVGQNLGAGKPERAEKSVWRTGFYNMIFLGAVAVMFLFFADSIVRVFDASPAAHAHARDALRIIAAGYVFYAFGMVMAQSFNGAGDTFTPTLINVVGFWMIQLPLAYTLSQWTSLRLNGAFAAVAISESSIAVMGMILFRRGKWKTRKV